MQGKQSISGGMSSPPKAGCRLEIVSCASAIILTKAFIGSRCVSAFTADVGLSTGAFGLLTGAFGLLAGALRAASGSEGSPQVASLNKQT